MWLWGRNKIASMGLGKSAPAAWIDEHGIISRYKEYVQDGIEYGSDFASRRWWSGYYATPIPPEEACAWIERHKRYLSYQQKLLAVKVYGYKF